MLNKQSTEISLTEMKMYESISNGKTETKYKTGLKLKLRRKDTDSHK